MMINITIIIIIIVITIHLFISFEQQVQDISQETASRRWPTPSKVLQWFHIHRAPRQGDMLAELRALQLTAATPENQTTRCTDEKHHQGIPRAILHKEPLPFLQIEESLAVLQ